MSNTAEDELRGIGLVCVTLEIPKKYFSLIVFASSSLVMSLVAGQHFIKSILGMKIITVKKIIISRLHTDFYTCVQYLLKYISKNI